MKLHAVFEDRQMRSMRYLYLIDQCQTVDEIQRQRAKMEESSESATVREKIAWEFRS